MTRPAIQLYTLREVDLPFDALLERVAEAGFDGVEFAYRVTDEDPAAVRETLDESGLAAAGAHVPIDDLEEEFEETVAFYDTLDVDRIVVPWLDAEYFESEAGVADAAARLDALATHLSDEGMTLHYHNHDHEFVAPEDDERGFDTFLDATTCGIELDLGLAHAAGDDVVERLRDLGDRSRLVHLKDYDVEAGESVPVGEGDLDLPGIAAAVAENDSEWLVYEYEGADPLDTLSRAGERTRDLC